ncbi:MAG: hypothetical protein LBD59_03940, partial [Prevotellaceae bacterium]|nr:hypothetical protein [Prevotellaceae bacterium]
MFGRGCASSGLSWQAVPANKDANAGTACVDRADKVKPCPNKGTYRQIEAGEISIDLDTFIKIAEAIRMLVWLKPMRVIQYPENKALLSE